MKPYYDHAGITIYHGDCREVLPALMGTYETIVTDPVWPNASPLLEGWERPYELLDESAKWWGGKRVAIQLGCNSDPAILRAVSRRGFNFFRVVWLENSPSLSRTALIYLRYRIPLWSATQST